MMKTLYLDIFSGISGDMFIAAMIDLGVSEHQIRYKVADLGVGGYRINVSRKEKSGIAGVKFDVHLEAETAHEYAHAHAHPHPHERSKGGSSRVLNASFPKFVPAHAIPPEPPEHTHAVERNYSS